VSKRSKAKRERKRRGKPRNHSLTAVCAPYVPSFTEPAWFRAERTKARKGWKVRGLHIAGVNTRERARTKMRMHRFDDEPKAIPVQRKGGAPKRYKAKVSNPDRKARKATPKVSNPKIVQTEHYFEDLLTPICV